MTRGQLGDAVNADGVDKRAFYVEQQNRIADFANKVQDSQRILDQSSTFTNAGAMKIDGCDSEIKLNGITYTSSLNTYSCLLYTSRCV